ncbi:NYN domain-containing protein [Amycolatopsis sp. TRM77291]
MTVDEMETLIVHPSVDAFVLASGDNDFSPLVSKLREFGKYVIGVGAETSSVKPPTKTGNRRRVARDDPVPNWSVSYCS